MVMYTAPMCQKKCCKKSIKSIHISMIYTAYLSGLQGSWSQSELTSAERQGTPWVAHQPILGGLIQR